MLGFTFTTEQIVVGRLYQNFDDYYYLGILTTKRQHSIFARGELGGDVEHEKRDFGSLFHQFGTEIKYWEFLHQTAGGSNIRLCAAGRLALLRGWWRASWRCRLTPLAVSE